MKKLSFNSDLLNKMELDITKVKIKSTYTTDKNIFDKTQKV
jgi:hypothetical protein